MSALKFFIKTEGQPLVYKELNRGDQARVGDARNEAF